MITRNRFVLAASTAFMNNSEFEISQITYSWPIENSRILMKTV